MDEDRWRDFHGQWNQVKWIRNNTQNHTHTNPDTHRHTIVSSMERILPLETNLCSTNKITNKQIRYKPTIEEETKIARVFLSIHWCKSDACAHYFIRRRTLFFRMFFQFDQLLLLRNLSSGTNTPRIQSVLLLSQSSKHRMQPNQWYPFSE